MLILVTTATAKPVELQSEQVLIRCEDISNVQFCVASAHLRAPVQAVLRVILDVDSYPKHFQSVTAASQDADGDLNLSFALPWPLGTWSPHLRVQESTQGTTTQIKLTVTRESGDTPLYTEQTWTVRPTSTGCALQINWTSSLRWPSFVRSRIHRAQGHNLVWGVAKGAHTSPTASVPPHRKSPPHGASRR